MTQLYEFGGVSDVILKAYTPMKIKEKQYEKNEPITVFEDCSIDWSFLSTVSISEGKKTYTYNKDLNSRSLLINNIGLTDKILSMFLTFLPDVDKVSFPKKETLSCVLSGENKILLTTEKIVNNIFVYNAKHEKIACEKLDNFSIVSENFAVDERYLVFYETEREGEKYKSELPHLPYFSLDILIKGNKDKNTGEMYIKVEPVSLSSTPNLNSFKNTIMRNSLEFFIIDIGENTITDINIIG